ncbi:MAG: hypothetical protein CL524_09370 [Aequorivita sp.]|nr:hypothetical protein [Aequorivita sp.]MBF29736.1 hypothetical protein [Aequorivita sp.]|tara:strand:- start:75872 stop:77338 length:1467 start_codon:yes stop_codon:yes gene_type:complete
MKKVIFCAVALMIGAVALGQTDPYAPYAPSLAQGLVPGPAPAWANMSYSSQNGNNNKVSVFQIGTKQGAYTIQDDGSGMGGNQGRIIQTGNVGPNSGMANMAELHQKGTTNQSTQYQYGDRNEALVNQGMGAHAGDDGSANNKALIQHGATNAQQGERNMAQVDQDGVGNQARTQQRVDRNEALTDQYGDNNYADIFQNAAPDGGKGHEAEIDQDGDNNDAWINQKKGTGGWNSATAIQVGGGNFSYQEQESDAANGESNDALATQGDIYIGNPMAAALYTTLDGIDDITNGAYNPGSDNAKAFQFQLGDDNIVVSGQFGDGNYSEQHQTGDDNDALIVQNAYGNPAGGTNYAKQSQIGDGNVAGIVQNGMNNRALQAQTGSDNIALSTQRGRDNDTYIHQAGNSSFASTAQRGQCNDILVVQFDGQWAKVEQNLSGGLPGGNNTATIYQANPNSNTSDVGCRFDEQLPTINQNDIPIFNIPDICPGC